MISSGRGSFILLIVCLVVFGVLILLLAGQNRELKAEVSSLRTLLAEATISKGESAGTRRSLQVGESVGPLAMVNVDGEPSALAFPGAGPTMLFMLGRHCGSCDQAIPIYDDIVRAFVAGAAPTTLRVVGVIADAPAPGDVSAAGKAAWEDAFSKSGRFVPSFAVPDGPRTWLLKVNATPAAVLLDKGGKVLGVWRGEVNKEQSEAMRRALADAMDAE